MKTVQNHLMPFLWITGESENIYRRLVRAIDEANCKAFCVEARPHEQFCQDKWWRDLSVILDEAERRGMKVWILDDKHFPSGFANGGALNAPLNCRRQSIAEFSIKASGGKKVKINLKSKMKIKTKRDIFGFVMDIINGNGKIKFNDDEVFSVTAYGKTLTDLMGYVKNGVLECTLPKDTQTIECCFLTRNAGIHRSYINMLESSGVKILIDEVYEKHFEHFKDKFGSVIAGFFSDEPELGNSYYCNKKNRLGEDPTLDLCWSKSLETELESALGNDYKKLLPLLWKNGYDKDLTAKVRYTYMDCVTKLVRENFSKQIGDWCRARGVDYIGHIIEDADLHCRTGSALGHYFRGMQYQSMGGVDCISDQILPFGEESVTKSFLFGEREGEFYHYMLAKFASSIAAINPIMNGNSFCEIFGNYGWHEGVRLEKYLIDHFLVRGVNNFVPHAFNCKPYPDKDCPPHFYAHGNNPQYRHFGELMRYTNEICTLTSGGKADIKVAVLYHGEAEWTGEYMLTQKPACVLYDNNIDFCIIPSDVFAEKDFYRTSLEKGLKVGNAEFDLLVIPYAERITKEVAEAIVTLLSNGTEVIFIDGYPKGISTGEELPQAVKKARISPLNKLAAETEKYRQIVSVPKTNRLRSYSYNGERKFVLLVNESKDCYSGRIKLSGAQNAFLYDAWEQKYLPVKTYRTVDGIAFDLKLETFKSVVVFTDYGESPEYTELGKQIELKEFTQSVTRAIDYPKFQGTKKAVAPLNGISKKKFSGYVRYETKINLNAKKAILEIDDAYEGVEVFINGKSCGIQVVPKFAFDITDFIRNGENEIAIEVATTLEREVKGKSKAPYGIVGKVTVKYE